MSDAVVRGPHARLATALLGPASAMALAVLVPVAAFLYHLHSQPLILQDDARQHIVWFRRYLDATLFQGDFIADYFLSSNYPLYRAAYEWPARLGLDPLAMANVYIVLLSVACAAGIYVLTRRLTGSELASAFAAIFLSLWLWADDYLASASARSFAWPALIWMLAFFSGRQYVAAGLMIVVQAFVYPVCAVISLTIVAVCTVLSEAPADVLRLRSPGSRAAFALSIVGVLSLLPLLVQVDPFGPEITAAQARMLPEAGELGVRPFFLGSALDYWVFSKRSGLLPRYTFEPWQILLVAALSVPLLRGPRRLYATLAAIGLSGAGLWLLAHLVLFELYLPGRYPTYCFGLVFVIAAAVVAARMVERAGIPRRLAVFVPMLLVLPGLALGTYPSRSLEVSKTPRIFDALREGGRPGLVGGLSYVLDNVPGFTGRGVTAAPEFHHWYKRGYHDEISRRISRTAAALISPSPDALLSLADELNIAAWVVSRDFHDEGSPVNRWITPVLVQAGTSIGGPEQLRRSWLLRQQACVAVQERGQLLYWTECLRAAAAAQVTAD